MNNTNQAFGCLLRGKREALNLSQMELCRKMKWPQAKVSRVEQGKRSVTLSELLAFAQVFRCSVNGLLGELEMRAVGEPKVEDVRPPEPPKLSPGFYAAYGSEDALLSQLARYGVRFLGSGTRPAWVDLSLEETVLAALKFSNDPRVFEALPVLVLRNAHRLDWTRLVSASYSLQLQNRLGMVVAAALQLRDRAKDVDHKVWTMLKNVHDTLAEAKLDREHVVGPRPQTEEARAFLQSRTPGWLRFWHGLSSADLESFQRYLVR